MKHLEKEEYYQEISNCSCCGRPLCLQCGCCNNEECDNCSCPSVTKEDPQNDIS
jgi:hypothetical protein